MLNGFIGQKDRPAYFNDFSGKFNLKSQTFYKTVNEWPSGRFGFDIKNMTKDKEVNTNSTYQFGTQEDTPEETYISPDGNYFFMIGSGADRLQRITLTTTFDIETGSSSTSQSLTAGDLNTAASSHSVGLGNESAFKGVWFRRDGLKFYIVGSSRDKIAGFNLSAAWDLTSTVTVNSVYRFNAVTRPDGTSGGETPSQIFFKPDGSRFYMVGTSRDAIYQFSIPSGQEWNADNATQDGNGIAFNNLLVGDYLTDTGVSQNPSSFYIEPEGNRLFVYGSTDDVIYEYYFATPWDITTLVPTGRKVGSVDTTVTSPKGITFTEDSQFMYLCGSNIEKVLRFKRS